MPVASAALLLYRLEPELQVLLAHMGGPFWASRDDAAWSIPKGEYDPDVEQAVDAATREFQEELGVAPPTPPYAELGTFPYASGKRVTVFVVDGSAFAPAEYAFGEFEMDWPPRSGKTARFPEVDRVAWMDVATARGRLVKGQRPALDALASHLAEASGTP